MQQRFLLRRGFSGAAEADVAAVGCGQDDIGALQDREQRQRLHRRNGPCIVDSALRRLGDDCRPRLEPMFQGDPQE